MLRIEPDEKIGNPDTRSMPLGLHLENLLNALGYDGPRPRRQYMCLCPAHEDRTPSLSVRATDDGKILLHCFAGCRTSEIVRTLGLTLRDLMPSGPGKAVTGHRPASQSRPAKASARNGQRGKLGRIVAEYEYRDADDRLICQVVRYEPKAFRQRSQRNGEWIWSIHGIRPPLYRLPELLRAPVDAWVFIVEGEKDVEALRCIGLTATCNIHGAGKWRVEYNHWLTNRRVCILPDNDEAGRQHARSVAQQLMGITLHVQILELPELAAKGDVSDWLAQGGDAKKLIRLANQTPSIPCGYLPATGVAVPSAARAMPRLQTSALPHCPISGRKMTSAESAYQPISHESVPR